VGRISELYKARRAVMPKCPTGAHDANFTLSTEGAPEGVRLVVCSICSAVVGAVPIPQTEIAKKRIDRVANEMVGEIEKLFTGSKK
jgi:hypothetical protein